MTAGTESPVLHENMGKMLRKIETFEKFKKNSQKTGKMSKKQLTLSKKYGIII